MLGMRDLFKGLFKADAGPRLSVCSMRRGSALRLRVRRRSAASSSPPSAHSPCVLVSGSLQRLLKVVNQLVAIDWLD
jgi:hypothetical protein